MLSRFSKVLVHTLRAPETDWSHQFNNQQQELVQIGSTTLQNIVIFKQLLANVSHKLELPAWLVH